MRKIGILGGGIAGLSLGYFLGADSEVLEKDSKCGGLCRSFEKDGFTYDLGGHIIFSKDTEILDFELNILGDRVNKLRRHASVWFKKRFVKYPFENGIGVLDKEDIYDCLYNFLNNPPRELKTFEDWIYGTFGKGFAEHYLMPYNQKIWKTHPSKMGVRWVERIPKPPAEDIIRSALGIETEGYTHQLFFWYPKTGGFETLPATLEENIADRVTKNFPVKTVRKVGNRWLVSNGSETREYESIINTMPIYDFMAALGDAVPPEVQRAVDALKYNSLIVVMVGLNRPRQHEQVATFFPQPDIVFHRLVFFDYFGSNYVPEGCSSYVVEITGKDGDSTFSMTDDQVAARVVDDLAREGFLEKNEVITTAVRRVKYAYTIYDLDREDNLEIIYAWCREQGIELCGRFAEFQYYNSDAVIRSAKTVADRVKREASLHA